MDGITLKTPAKINITLDVVGKRPDGYHEVQMIMEMVELWDIVTISKREDKDIVISSNNDKIPTDNRNIAYKAARLLMDNYNLAYGVNIHIDKKIPVAAGLAGGSTNAAGVLKGMNSIFNLNISEESLMDLGLALGADVPYCILGKTALAEGIGERLTILPPFPKIYVLLSKIDAEVSTAAVYQGLDLNNINNRPNTANAIEGIGKGDMGLIANSMYNVLEEITTKSNPQILDIKNLMMELGSIKAMMSGSGPTVFGLFSDYHKAIKAYDILKDIVKETFLVQTL